MLRDRIIEETTTLFVRNGVKSMRMDDIASELGISKRTIYEQFSDRESLIEACARHFFETKDADHQRRVTGAHDIIEAFILLLEDWDEMMKTDMNFMKDLARFYPAIHKKIQEENHRKGRERLKASLQQAVNEGIFKPGLNLDFTVVALMSSISTVFATPSVYEEVKVSTLDAFKYITILFFRGISTEKGIRLIDETYGKYFSKELFSVAENNSSTVNSDRYLTCI